METATDRLRESFLRERRKGIGGSDVAAIFGLDPYKTAEDAWLEKTGQVIPIDEPSGDKERGVRLEPVAAELYSERSGIRLSRVGNVLVHSEYPWMRANIDLLATPDADENFIVEIKCPSLGMYSKIKREGLPYNWTLQGQHYLAVTGLRKVVWVIFCADRWELIDFPVERDELVIDRIIEKEREFWQYVETMSPPPNVVAEVQNQQIVVVGSVTKRSDESFVQAMTNLKEARAVAKTGEELVEAAKAQVLELVDQQPGIYQVSGVGRVNYAMRSGRVTLDVDRLEAAKPLDRNKLLALIVDESGYTDAGRFILIKDLNEAAMQGGLNLDLSEFRKQGQPFADFRFFGSRDEG